jgi:phenylpyruvate tautomerase PptA (4-oxalocrotonate tautomerase family)
VRNIEEKLEHIVAGRAITFVPWTVESALGLQPEVVAVLVEDIPPVQVCLGWSSEGESAEIRAFAEAARSALGETVR